MLQSSLCYLNIKQKHTVKGSEVFFSQLDEKDYLKHRAVERDGRFCRPGLYFTVVAPQSDWHWPKETWAKGIEKPIAYGYLLFT